MYADEPRIRKADLIQGFNTKMAALAEHCPAEWVEPLQDVFAPAIQQIFVNIPADIPIPELAHVRRLLGERIDELAATGVFDANLNGVVRNIVDRIKAVFTEVDNEFIAIRENARVERAFAAQRGGQLRSAFEFHSRETEDVGERNYVRLVKDLPNTGPTGLSSGPYGHALGLARVPNIFPYNPIEEFGVNVRHSNGIFATSIAAELPCIPENLPRGILELLTPHALTLQNLQLFFCVQDRPWSAGSPLLLRPHPWIHPEATEMANVPGGTANVVSQVFCGITDINGQFLALAPRGLSTHGGPSNVYSGAEYAIRGIEDFNRSHALYSLCIDKRRNCAALTLHWLLNDADHEQLQRILRQLRTKFEREGTFALSELITEIAAIPNSMLNHAEGRASGLTPLGALRILIAGNPAVLGNQAVAEHPPRPEAVVASPYVLLEQTMPIPDPAAMQQLAVQQAAQLLIMQAALQAAQIQAQQAQQAALQEQARQAALQQEEARRQEQVRQAALQQEEARRQAEAEQAAALQEEQARLQREAERAVAREAERQALIARGDQMIREAQDQQRAALITHGQRVLNEAAVQNPVLLSREDQIRAIPVMSFSNRHRLAVALVIDNNASQRFLGCCFQGDLLGVQNELTANADINFVGQGKGSGHCTGLQLAILCDRMPVVAELLQRPEIDISNRNDNGRTALQLALDHGRWLMAEMISRLPVNQRLINAAAGGNIAELQMALEAGADINTILLFDPAIGGGFNALQLAIQLGRVDVIALMIAEGADLQYRANKFNMNALEIAENAASANPQDQRFRDILDIIRIAERVVHLPSHSL